MKKLLIIFGIAFGIVSCTSKVDLAIDNPSKNPILVSIDTLTVEIPPKEVVWVEMGKGPRKITLPNDSIVNYDFQRSVYMLNPTLSQYLKYGEVYGSNPMAKFNYRLNDTVNFYGFEFVGDYKVIKDLVNTVNWDYGPRESLPSMVQVEEGSSFTTVYKLMDINEFIEEINKRAQETATTEENKTK
ncbi:hypothetical protein P8625_15880 [Tenacibaculum tangerinum]|uniref:Lipoprotein n=1 Tax=Tenacibaculum tangerinum TaxID=3038772 RepID=A0ABY8L243_9FLAO|nr:hypothetical protein [Tenacibaculum tangerinum]WGH75518.1 hypothetical protein P8625_15880 [Tenacibaculum tangerinum]